MYLLAKHLEEQKLRKIVGMVRQEEKSESGGGTTTPTISDRK